MSFQFTVIGANVSVPGPASGIRYTVRINEGDSVYVWPHMVTPPAANRWPDTFNVRPAIGYRGVGVLHDDGRMTFPIIEFPDSEECT